MSDEQQAFIPAHTVDELPPHANWTGGSKYSRYFDGKVWALDYREFGLDSEERLRRSLVSTSIKTGYKIKTCVRDGIVYV